MGALVLDFLLLIMFLMMVPIGFYRGGVRELCVSAGLLLGILMTGEWAEQWASVFERMFGMSNGNATFLMSALITFSITALFGYGGSSVFSWRPGPGGRLYGAYLALFNAMIATGFLINRYGEYIAPATDGEPITSGILARTLSDDFGVILLVATIGIGLATIFGMFVRERSDELPAWQAPSSQLSKQQIDTRPYRDHESEKPPAVNEEPVRILDVQEWEDRAETKRPDPGTYGSGWRQTWPESSPRQSRVTPNLSKPASTQGDNPHDRKSNTGKNVIADWINDQEDN